MRYLVLSVSHMHHFYRISMGLWVPAFSEIDNGKTWPLTNFWILLLKLLEFCHKALTNASLSWRYPITAQALVSVPDYSLASLWLHFLAVGRFSGLLSQHSVISLHQKDGGFLQPCLSTGRLPLSIQSNKSCSVVPGTSAKARCPYHISHINSPRL